ncbi:ABC transporter permease [Pararhodobacter aggregans]|uniref:Iron ABC transporter permease n=1 Tax=Pararhodobacter aggregans TaxID=404875 RepID=A0A2T7UQR2_9RHOB|nr:iron ABC transporter permease [Pararhodobacter aggregans]PTX01818.1 iron(III) transport system permease protein [Pararhodobacter aggregans]PVE47017.1 iron ABC transporter permease [Pararhodobacter aggregans]
MASIASSPDLRRRRRRISPWSLGALAVAALIALPIAAVVLQVFRPTEGAWSHLAATVLPLYLSNSLLLVLLSVTMASLVGVGAGWLIAGFEFRGRGVLQWALMLPMTMPGYVIAYVYYEQLAYAGPVQSGLRALFGWGRQDYWFPQIASLPGAALMLSAVLYPYIYLLTRAAFATQSLHLMEAARALGQSPRGAFFRVALPMARPAIVAGAAFVAMETLADFGTVSHLGVQTLTTGIFRTWFGRGQPVAAAQLAALLIGFVALALVLERILRGTRRYVGDPGGRGASAAARHRLGGWRQAVVMALCAIPILVGFVIPVSDLVRRAILVGDPMWGARFYAFAGNSLMLAGLAALVLLTLGLFLGYARRMDGGPLVRAALGVAGIGYAMPGAVIAVGVLLPLSWADQTLDTWMRASFGLSTGLLLTGSYMGLIFAYAVRFLSISLNTIEASLQRIPPSLDDAARGLGSGPARTLLSVHFPLLRGGLLSAAIFIFADVMKELPATLIVRPFNLDTLAIRTYRLASDGRLDEASTSALVIVALGIIPVVLLSRAMDRPGSH